MSRLTTRIALLLTLAPLASPALAADPPMRLPFTEQQKERILKPCLSVPANNRPRCEARAMRNAELEWSRAFPGDAYAVYDWMDLGGNHLRARLQNERSTAFQEYWSENRTTFSNFKPTEDINTTRLPYVNRIRESRLDCMYVPHGRPRALCFDQQIDTSQKMMRPLHNRE
ncbi:MAG: hypothetical protein PHX87_01925 [Candidatus Peribacteraceae bacterium]|nr:hypothetical protein [Candidatus Peribacteraceae bacterium]MDD5742165.1 hypothetical protein [Candidatus Peribacteraceae bacterium]